MKYIISIASIIIVFSGVSQAEIPISRVVIVKSKYSLIKLCIASMQREFDKISEIEKIYGGKPGFEAHSAAKDNLTVESKYSNYYCDVTEYEQGVYTVIYDDPNSGVIYEESQWYDSKTYEYLGMHTTNPRVPPMNLPKPKGTDGYISVKFLVNCHNLFGKIEATLKKRYPKENAKDIFLADPANYDVVIMERNSHYDVILLENNTYWPFNNLHNMMFTVDKSNCNIMDVIQTEIQTYERN